MTTPPASWTAHEATRLGTPTPAGGRWACSVRAIVRGDTLALALRVDRAGGKCPRAGSPAILHDVPRSALRTLTAALLALADDVATEPVAP